MNSRIRVKVSSTAHTFSMGRLERLTSACTHTFASNDQLLFLNKHRRENDRRNDFMINLHKDYVAELGFKLATSGSKVRRTTANNKVWSDCPETLAAVICCCLHILFLLPIVYIRRPPEKIILLHSRICQKMYLRTCAPSEESGQPVHLGSLIRIFAGQILDDQGYKVYSCGELIRRRGCMCKLI